MAGVGLGVVSSAAQKGDRLVLGPAWWGAGKAVGAVLGSAWQSTGWAVGTDLGPAWPSAEWTVGTDGQEVWKASRSWWCWWCWPQGRVGALHGRTLAHTLGSH